MITAEDLHHAADVLGRVGADEARLAAYGLPFEELGQFIEGSEWRDISPGGPKREMDPLALAMGISIGVVAARQDAGHG